MTQKKGISWWKSFLAMVAPSLISICYQYDTEGTHGIHFWAWHWGDKGTLVKRYAMCSLSVLKLETIFPNFWVKKLKRHRGDTWHKFLGLTLRWQRAASKKVSPAFPPCLPIRVNLSHFLGKNNGFRPNTGTTRRSTQKGQPGVSSELGRRKMGENIFFY